MNVELFNYSIMASILGISIVFISLVGLCLLMVLLKVVFQEREKPAEPPVESAAGSAPAASGAAQENNDWIMAAVAAFLMEEDGIAPSAAGWAPRAAEASDPWMNRASFGNKLG